MSVKVGVRVRPFNKRELQLGSKLVVQMEGTTTQITDSDGQKKTFSYDYSFWSHDGFQEDENGYNQPTGNNYADQQQVYKEIGSSILTNAWYFCLDLGTVITVVCLLMDRPGQARAIL